MPIDLQTEVCNSGTSVLLGLEARRQQRREAPGSRWCRLKTAVLAGPRVLGLLLQMWIRYAMLMTSK